MTNEEQTGPQSRPKRDFTPLKLTPKQAKEERETKVLYGGRLRKRGDVQTELNELDADERVACITEHRRHQITNQLEVFRKDGDLENGKAVFKEYEEFLDDENSENFDDFWCADWINSFYLKELSKRKKVNDFWRDIDSGSNEN